MAKLYELKTFTSDNGNLTVFERMIPGTIQRVFYIYKAGHSARAGHRHIKAWNALICLGGSCRVYAHDGNKEDVFHLKDPSQCLVLEPEDWHVMYDFSEDAILLVVSNEPYDKDDYIQEPYPNSHWDTVSALAGS
ncbi:FdtA/QdtA family cupin domain-containing protein [Spirosoma sp. BT702]|uniref:FdtA/QdtA family cupin domain-containing protein n=1 Tax=Spirosoma profusum TaxID=2771354 RepID=A0A927AQK0_9BACT|nr:FdtA/QdtA family cupin domain-containing protein [Spirosoma profusum]MBD2700631.1 FdtA/QdtA family cupin domain-containing protein [Spirosoma profusum]